MTSFAGAAGPRTAGQPQRDAARHAPRLPGEAASAVDPVNFWAALPRHILRSENSFSCFLRCLVKRRPFLPQASGTTSSLIWPMPLPYRFKTAGFDKATQARHNAVDLVVALLDWLHLGRPHVAPKDLLSRAKLSGEQRAVATRIEAMLSDVLCHAAVAASDMGRVASKIENLEGMIASLQQQGSALAARCHGYHAGPGHLPRFDPVEMEFGETVPDHARRSTLARPILASRVEFGDAAAFDPVKFLDSDCAAHYLNPLDYALGESEALVDPPRTRVLAGPGERPALLRKLDRGGRLRLLPSTLCRRRHLNGLFAIPKSLERDRLIMDARGPNLLEEGRVAWTRSMASAVSLFGTVLQPDEVLVFSGTDLRDYYYQYLVSPQRVIRNALALELSEGEARLFTCFEEKFAGMGPFRPCFNSMAMGDLNSVEFGQCAHLSLILNSGSVFPEELLTMKSQPSRSKVQGGVVIDDFVVVERMARQDFSELQPGTSLGADRLRKASLSYAEVHLPENRKKAFSEQPVAEFWGASLDGTPVRADLRLLVSCRCSP